MRCLKYCVLAYPSDGQARNNQRPQESAKIRVRHGYLAAALGAKAPRHIPGWLARLIAGEAAVVLMTEIRGASNMKAKRELGWLLRYPSRRQDFAAASSG